MGVAAVLRPPRLSTISRAALLGAPLAVLSAASLIGTLLAPGLLERNPLVLAALAPRSVFLVAAAARTPLPIFMVVGLVRLSVAGPPHFSIGQTWGRDVSTWLQRGPLPTRVVGRTTEWLFARLGPLALLVSPTGKTVALASASRVPPVRIAASVAAGVVVRLAIFYAIAQH
jgi:hypothetical protein